MQGSSQTSSLGRIHDRLALVLAVLVPLTAVPLASNRSSWWLIWTGFLAGLALLFLIRSSVAAGASTFVHRPRFLAHRALFALAVLMPLWAYVQTLPVAAYLPASLTAMAPGLEGLAGPAISVQPDAAMVGILRFLGYVLLIALVIEVASRRERVLRVAQIVYGGVCAQAIWALVALQLLGDFSPWGQKTAYLGSATGTFVNRNSLATFLGFGLVLGLGILAERGARAKIRASRQSSWVSRLRMGDLLIAVGMVFLFLALVATQSRLGLAASLTGALVTVALIRWRSGAALARLAGELAVLGGIAVAAVLVIAAGGGVAERFLFVANESVNRAVIYEQAMGMVALRPWTGFGMDAFGAAFEAFRAPPLLAPVTYDLAHNSYITLWVEFGLIFGTLPMLVLVAAAVMLWRRMGAEDGFPGLAIAGLGALVLGAVHSLGDFSLEIPANVYLLMLILGLGLGRLSRRRAGGGTRPLPGEGAE